MIALMDLSNLCGKLLEPFDSHLSFPLSKQLGCFEASLAALEHADPSGHVLAADHIHQAIAVEIHELWIEADASRAGKGGVLPASLEIRELVGEEGFRIRALVQVDPGSTSTELADDQVLLSVLVEVIDERRRMAGRGRDGLLAGQDLGGRFEAHRPGSLGQDGPSENEDRRRGPVT